MSQGLVDTTVIIHYFRKQPRAVAWMQAQANPLSVTSITWLEVMVGARNKTSQAQCKQILNHFNLFYLTAIDQQWAMQQFGSEV